MWIFSYYLHYSQKEFQNFSCTTCHIEAKIAVLQPPIGGLALIKCRFQINQIYSSKALETFQCLEIDKRRSLSQLVTSRELVHILQTGILQTDLQNGQSLRIDLKFLGSLTLILTIVQSFVKLPYLEFTFLEMSCLWVFRLCRLLIYRPDELFQNFLQIFMVIPLVVQGVVLFPLFTCNHMSKYLPGNH